MYAAVLSFKFILIMPNYIRLYMYIPVVLLLCCYYCVCCYCVCCCCYCVVTIVFVVVVIVFVVVVFVVVVIVFVVVVVDNSQACTSGLRSTRS